MTSQEWVSSARLRYLGTSAQKARLVVDLIRGKNVSEALTTLRHTRKTVAIDIGRMLDSAVANARQKKQDVDIDRLFVRSAFVDGGPSLKRIRPAPMGRAFRVLKRMCHVTIGLGERPARDGTAVPSAQAGTAAAAGTSARSAARTRPAGRAKKAAARGRARTGSRPKKKRKTAAGKKKKKAAKRS